MIVMHESSPWMLGKEDGFSEDLTGYSSGRWSDRCSRRGEEWRRQGLELRRERFLMQEKPKVRWGIV
jgi:hypothetical protein